MATEDRRNVELPASQAKPEGSHAPGGRRPTVELLAIFRRETEDVLGRLFAVIDDELFKRSNSESLTQQTLFFEAMRRIRMESAALRASFHQGVEAAFEAFLKGAAQDSRRAAPGEVRPVDMGDLALVENERLEEEVAVAAMAEKGDSLFQSQLFGLNQRLAVLAGRDTLETKDNPFGPRAVCEAFAAAVRPLRLDLTVKLLIFKLFDQVVLRALGGVYEALNECLIGAGVLPALPKKIKRGHTAGRPSPEAGEGVDDDPGAYLEVFQGLRRLLEGWRAHMGLASGGASADPPGPALATEEVLGILSALQASREGAPDAEGLKAVIARRGPDAQPGEARALARADEDIIDMVALIFDFILEDHDLPDAVKGLIARLQIPVVKVAILEKSFFARKNHPVRLLLNALAQAGAGLDPVEGGIDSPVFKKIETIVNRILDEFDQNVELFSDLLDEFMAFMDKEIQRSRVAEERTRQVTQSKEQLRLAKRKIAYEIAIRLQNKGIPAPVRSFLYNTWKDVLVLAYLRRDKQPAEWENALTVMDKLLWTVTPPADAAARKAIIQVIPKLLKAIRAGLESISLDPQAVANALKDLEASHVACLSLRPAEAPVEERAVEIRDPELAQAIEDIQSNLPDIENLTVSDLAAEPKPSDGGEPGFLVEDEHMFRARELPIGAWVEFDEGHKRVRGKLSWKSQVTSTYVFVNRKGAKALEISLNALAAKFAAGQARILEEAAAPLMDRAFGALLAKLRGPVVKPA